MVSASIDLHWRMSAPLGSRWTRIVGPHLGSLMTVSDFMVIKPSPWVSSHSECCNSPEWVALIASMASRQMHHCFPPKISHYWLTYTVVKHSHMYILHSFLALPWITGQVLLLTEPNCNTCQHTISNMLQPKHYKSDSAWLSAFPHCPPDHHTAAPTIGKVAAKTLTNKKTMKGHFQQQKIIRVPCSLRLCLTWHYNLKVHDLESTWLSWLVHFKLCYILI